MVVKEKKLQLVDFTIPEDHQGESNGNQNPHPLKKRIDTSI